jgi:uracil phosphoribosyltransferase
MHHNLESKNSLLSKFIAEIRSSDIQKDRMRFRRNMERIGEVFAYEISQTLQYQAKEVETPMGLATIQSCSDQVVIANILRAGIPMHYGILNYFDQADNAFISAYRMHHKDGSFEINLQYVSCPDLNDAVLIICDPMLATGASMDIAIKNLLEYGTPKQMHIATAIASAPGLEYIRRIYPNAHVWTGAVDEELTGKSYIVPGLGDAGDLSFGPKVQE